MMSDWFEYTLKDIADGFDHIRVPLSKLERSERQGIYPYYGASGVIDYIDDYLFDGEYVLISEDGENLRSRKTPIAFKVNGKFWVNNHAHIVKGKKPYLNDLIVYIFQNLNLHPFITGAAQPKLNQRNLYSIPFFLPASEKEQKTITHVLKSLDDKIDLLQRQNQTLEALADAIFREKIINNEGFIDGTWNEFYIGEKLEVLLGGTPSTKNDDYWGGDIPWINSGEINKFRITKPTKFITKLGLENSSTKLLPNNTTVIAITGATLGQISMLEIESCANQSVIGVLASEKFSNEYIYLWIKFHIEELILRKTGGAQQHINSGDVKGFPIVLPDRMTREKFNNFVKPLFKKISHNSKQIITLENIRDTLLPKLMSGEVRVHI